VVDGGGKVKGEFSYPLLPYLSKKVISISHLKILATPLLWLSHYSDYFFYHYSRCIQYDTIIIIIIIIKIVIISYLRQYTAHQPLPAHISRVRVFFLL
jgi:hypothetical protein